MAQALIASRWQPELDRLRDDVLEPLRRTEEFGEALHFGAAVDSIKVIRKLTVTLATQDPEFEPASLTGEITNHLKNTARFAEQIKNFDAKRGNAIEVRQQLLQGVQAERDWFAKSLSPYVRVAAGIEAAAAAADLAALRETAERDGAQIAEVLAAARQQAGTAGVAKLSGIYGQSVASHRKLGYAYLIASGVLILATLGLGLYLLTAPIALDLTQPNAWIDYLRYLLPRVFLIGVLTYALAFTVREFRANRSLEIAFQERCNVLDTYPLLIKAIDTEWARDRVTVALVQGLVTGSTQSYSEKEPDHTLADASAAASVIQKLR